MIKVLDLFAGTQSVRKALTEKYDIKEGKQIGNYYYGFNPSISLFTPVIEYIGIDIYSPEYKNTILDLTQDNIVEKLNLELKGGKPDFIGASPTCATGSIAAISHHGRVENYNKPNEKRIPISENAILGVKMLENTKKIIEFFNVPFAVENPRGTMRKHKLTFDGIRQTAGYCKYTQDLPLKDRRAKPTDIWTNKPIKLLTCKNGADDHVSAPRGARTGTQGISNYAEKSAVPPKLIISILDSLL